MIPVAPMHISLLQDKETLQKYVQIEHHTLEKEQRRKGIKNRDLKMVKKH